MDDASYNKGREDQAKFTISRLRNRDFSIKFMCKAVGYDADTVIKWLEELEYEENFELGKLLQAQKMARRLHEMGWAIKDIVAIVGHDADTVTEWIETK